MKAHSSDSKQKFHAGRILPLPPPLEFQLSSLISSTNISAKGSLNKSTEEYQKDLRKELKKALSHEQKLQHKNIRIMKLSGELGIRLEKSKKIFSRVQGKSTNHTKRKSAIKYNDSALNELEIRFSRTSELAHNSLLRLSKYSKRTRETNEIIQERAPLMNIYITSTSEAQTLTEIPVTPEAISTSATNNQKREDEFDPDEYQSIMETNIAIYREGIIKKHKQNNENDDFTSQGVHSPRVGLGNFKRLLGRKPSLKTFANPKSPATVFETNLNSLHKKLRINPHPLAIYNESNHLDSVCESDNLKEELKPCEYTKPNTLQYVDQEVLTPSDSTSEALYIRLLLISEGPTNKKSSNSPVRVQDVKRGCHRQSSWKNTDLSSSTMRSKLAKRERSHFEFLPVQKHLPLHHTHRPTQSILKKTESRHQVSKELKDLKDDHICERVVLSSQTSKELSISPVLAIGSFVSRSQRSAPLLSAISQNELAPDN